MKNLSVCAAILTLAAGCAAAPNPEQRQEEAAAKQETVEQILSQPLAAEDYSEQDRCLSTFSYRSIEVLDDRHVLFRGAGDNVWLNTLRNRCIGLRPNETLRFSLRDNRVCDMDSFEAVDFQFAGRISGKCTLGPFSRVSPEQAEALALALKGD